MEESISMAMDDTDHIVLNGDWNIDFLKDLPPRLRSLFDLFNLRNVLSEPTRITALSSTCIDPIIISDAVKISECGTIDIPSDISDHYATYVSLCFESPIPVKYKRDIWLYKQADFSSFNAEIRAFEWNDLFSPLNINACILTFNRILIDMCKKFIPLKTVTIRPNDKPWYNSIMRHESRIRDRLHKIYVRTQSLIDKVKFRKQRNKVNNLKKSLQDSYYESLNDTLSEYKSNNPRQYWTMIRSLLRGTKPCQNIPPIIHRE
ncbi:hypothetical protein FSP39_003197 [Pinctada imbricata]|uniref:Endonuclease/exonuclease/phosphatase domain-containing protein n=1 Tax=Pinctada imbricata TaxID=66713 RepID=A0AA88YKJ9_PINIB|nr:hypothetical protein FSP39_003197 [Pinctada imbricata]